MPCIHEFGIIDRLDPGKDYGGSYEPRRYGCAGVDDDLLDDWWPVLEELPTFFHTMGRPGRGLARYGVTLIPPASLPAFRRAVAQDPRRPEHPELEELLAVLDRAAAQGRTVIHYGV